MSDVETRPHSGCRRDAGVLSQTCSANVRLFIAEITSFSTARPNCEIDDCWRWCNNRPLRNLQRQDMRDVSRFASDVTTSKTGRLYYSLNPFLFCCLYAVACEEWPTVSMYCETAEKK